MVAIVQPSANLMPVDINNPLFHVESAGRTCYKSEDRVTSDSAKKFVEMIKGIGHFSVIEHLALIWKISDIAADFWLIPDQLISFLVETEQIQITKHKDFYLLSMNLRSLIELVRSKGPKTLQELINLLQDEPITFLLGNNIEYHPKGNFVEFFGYAGAHSTWDLLAKLSQQQEDASILQHIWITIRLVTDRGVTHELVRHRPPSYSQESTRFCNYGKDKFGNQISVIEPPGLSVEQRTQWFKTCEYLERIYLGMIREGVAPQIARSILPNCLKTEIVTTTHLKEWQYIFQMRLWNEKAHPQMRQLMQLAYDQFSQILPDIFPKKSIYEVQQ